MMRAKFVVQSVTKDNEIQERLHLTAVGDKPYGPAGESDDNTYARYTPMGNLTMTINNPALTGHFHQGQKFYLDFTEAVD